MQSVRAGGRIVIAGGVGAALGALIWLWGNATRGPIAYRPGEFIVPAVVAGLGAGIGAQLVGGIQARDAKASATRMGLLAAGGALALGLVCGLVFAVLESAINTPAYHLLYLRVVLLVAVAGLGLAGGALVGLGRGVATLLGALAAVGLGEIWGLAVSLGAGLVVALKYHPCVRHGYCLDDGPWHGLRAALDQLTVAGFALGLVTALGAVVALALLPRRAT